MSRGQQIIKKTIRQDMAQLMTHSSLLSSHPLFVDVTVNLLKRGATVRFRAAGNSMYPVINEGEIITVEPVKPSQVKRKDIVLYQNHHGVIAHRVVAIKTVSNQQSATSDQKPENTSILNPQSSIFSILFILRGDSASECDQPVEPQKILGKVVSVERKDRHIPLNSLKAKMFHTARHHASLLKQWIVRISL